MDGAVMRQLTGAIGRLHDHLSSASFALAQVCILVIVTAYSYETIARYFFSAPTSWSNEVVGYALCIGTFLALPHVTRAGGHIAITFLLDSLSQSRAMRFRTVLAFVSAAVCLFVAWVCLQTNIQHFSRNEMTVGVNPIPKAWISIWLTYGFFSSGVHFLRQAFERRTPTTG